MFDYFKKLFQSVKLWFKDESSFTDKDEYTFPQDYVYDTPPEYTFDHENMVDVNSLFSDLNTRLPLVLTMKNGDIKKVKGFPGIDYFGYIYDESGKIQVINIKTEKQNIIKLSNIVKVART